MLQTNGRTRALPRIGIAGGGIGGLAVAVALLRTKRFEVRVYERAPARSARGAALLLWSNAISALTTLDLDEQILNAAARLETTDVRTRRGELLSSLPVGEWSRRAGAPTVVIRRPTLLDILAGALPEGTVRTGTQLRSFEATARGLTLRFEDGTREDVDALVGADGLRSVVRRQLRGEEALRISPYDAWVGICPERPAEIRDGVATATVGEGPRFWTAALRDGSVFWYATINRRGRAVADREDLRRVLRDWHRPIDDIVASTPDHEIVRTQVRDRLPVDRWGDGSVTLLGDAAHPATPDLGQGACQAIESAVVLGDCLAEADRIDAGLREYERRRMGRTAAISRLCWMTSANSTLENALMCRIRDQAVRLGLESVARSSFAWILAGHPR